MTFEFEPNKSASNKIKHGIDFDEAKELWNDPYAIELPSLQDLDEERFLVLGRVGGKHYTAIVTYRGSISVRRSRKKEIALYESVRNR